MGIRKKVITEVTYVCDNNRCGKEGDDESLFATDVPVMKGTVKEKIVLCDDCKDEHDEFMARYFPEGEEEATQEDEYDPTTDRAFSKYTPEEALYHRKAKLWAVGANSTMKGNERPKGLKGPAGPKVLDAYKAYLAGLADDIDAGVAIANGKAAT